MNGQSWNVSRACSGLALVTAHGVSLFSYFRRIFGEKQKRTSGFFIGIPTENVITRLSLIRYLFLAMKCLHSESMRSTLEGSHKLERQSMSRSTSDNIGRSTKFGELLVPNICGSGDFGKK